MTDEALTELNRKIAIMEASKTQQIQFRIGSSKQWEDISVPCIAWNWLNVDYRVKPVEPLIVTYEKAKGTETLFYGPTLTTQRPVETIAFIELTPEIRKALNL